LRASESDPERVRTKPLKTSRDSPRLTFMKKEETLQRIKEVEDQVRRSKDEVLAERERVLRTARRDSLDLRDALRAQAEGRGEAILKAAEAAIAKEKEGLLAAGRRGAADLRGQADANIDRAVDRLIEKFKGALNA